MNSGKWGLVSCHFPRFPRRQRQFSLLIYDSKDRLAARFIVENPLPLKECPEWTAQPLPATNTIDGIQVVLRGFEREPYIIERETTTGEIIHRNIFWNKPIIEIAPVAGEPRDFRERPHRFLDTAGNKDRFWELSPQEPVWKRQLKLYQSRDDVFAAKQRFQFANIPVPAAGETASIQKTVEIDGIAFRMLFLSGPGATAISNHFANTNLKMILSDSNSTTISNRFTDAGNLKIHAEKLEPDRIQEISEYKNTSGGKNEKKYLAD